MLDRILNKGGHYEESLSVEMVIVRIEEAKGKNTNYFLVTKKEFKNNFEIQSYFEANDFFVQPIYDFGIIYYEVYFEGVTHTFRTQMNQAKKADKYETVANYIISAITLGGCIFFFYLLWNSIR